MNINYTGPGTNLPSYNKQDRVDLFYDYKYFCKHRNKINSSKFQFVPNHSKLCHEKHTTFTQYFICYFCKKTIALVMGNEFYIELHFFEISGRDKSRPYKFSIKNETKVFFNEKLGTMPELQFNG